MSTLKRKILVACFFLLFLVLAPIIIFYANGNILGRGWSILATGGIFVRSMDSGTQLFINDELENITNFFTHDFLIKNLKPGVYNISVRKDGYNSWTNKINVYANRVSESRVFMLPTEVVVGEVKEFLIIEKSAGTTTEKIKRANPDYKKALALFDKLEDQGNDIEVLSTTTGQVIKYAFRTRENPIKDGHLSVWKEGNEVYLGWDGSLDSTPRIFCQELLKEMTCQSELKVYSFIGEVENLDFFPGESEVIIVNVADNIYALETENNPDKKPQIIYSGVDPDFRVYNNNEIYIKDGTFLGLVEL